MSFEYFFDTKDTIPEGVGIKMFGAEHILLNVLGIVFIILMCLFFNKLSKSGKDKMIVCVSVALVIDEIIKHVTEIANSTWKVDYLPLHICSVMLVLSVIYVITKNKTIAQLMYCLGIPGALIALITPTWLKLPIFNLMHLHSYTVHILLILFPILLVMNGETPSFKYYKKCILSLVVYAIPIYFFNKAFDTDFIFLNGAKETPFKNLAKAIGDPWYILCLLPIVALVMALMILPWHLKEKKKAIA